MPELGIVDLVNRRLEIHRGARRGGYAEVTAVARRTAAPTGLAAATVEMAALFGCRLRPNRSSRTAD